MYFTFPQLSIFIKFWSFILKQFFFIEDTKKNQRHLFNTFRLRGFSKFHIWKSAQSCFQFSFPTLVSNNYWQKEERVWLTLNCTLSTGYFWGLRVKKFQDLKVTTVFIPIHSCLISRYWRTIGRFREGFVCLFICFFFWVATNYSFKTDCFPPTTFLSILLSQYLI